MILAVEDQPALGDLRPVERLDPHRGEEILMLDQPAAGLNGAFAGLALPRFPPGGAFALSERARPAPRNPARRLAIMPVQNSGPIRAASRPWWSSSRCKS
jgi:hypothetical protein